MVKECLVCHCLFIAKSVGAKCCPNCKKEVEAMVRWQSELNAQVKALVSAFEAQKRLERGQ